MPALATLEELKDVETSLSTLKENYPEAYEAFSVMFKNYRKVGYKNICKLLLGEVTPEKLKGQA